MMDPLVDELVAKGALDAAAVAWAKRQQAERGGPLSMALLELDLVEEQDLLQAMASCFALPLATREELQAAPELAERIPLSVSLAFELCPLRLQDSQLVVLVHGPLSRESIEELRELFGLEVRQLLCQPAALYLARDRLYGLPAHERSAALEARLARQRASGGVREVLDRIAGAGGFAAAAAVALGFANALMELAVFLRTDGPLVRVAATGSGHQLPHSIPRPEDGSSLAPALRHGSYFLGPLGGGPEDRAFYAALGRPVPRWAFVAPLPAARERSVFFYADNGALGMAPRRLTELTLVVACLGQQGSAAAKAAVVVAPPEDPELELTFDDTSPELTPTVDAEPATSAPMHAVAAQEPGVTAEERAVLARLHVAAKDAGLELEAFVDQLIGRRAAPSPEQAGTALMGEMRHLLERLATDIPAQMALGMQNAFREIVPRLAAPQPTSVGAHAHATSATPAAAAASAELVMVAADAKPREVPDYRSRRRKAATTPL